jgi:hypothetical protein
MCIKPEPRIAGGTEVKNRSKFAYQVKTQTLKL